MLALRGSEDCRKRKETWNRKFGRVDWICSFNAFFKEAKAPSSKLLRNEKNLNLFRIPIVSHIWFSKPRVNGVSRLSGPSEGSNTSKLKVENSRISTSIWTQLLASRRILVNGISLQKIPNSRTLFGKDKLTRDWPGTTWIVTWRHLNVRHSFSAYN